MFNVDSLSLRTKGIVLIVAGIIPLLYMLGIDSLKIIVIFEAFIVVTYGVMLANFHRRVMELLKKRQQKQ